MLTALDGLKRFSVVVADTGDFEQLAKFKPQDSTTNPSLLLAASELPKYRKLVEDAVEYGKQHGSTLDEQTERAMDKLAINFGVEILKIVPGRVSTEIDARLSFDTEGTLKKGKELIAMYKELGVEKDRVLLKIASTWEGLQAAKQFESEGLHVNMTLLFCVEQAAVAGEHGVTLISPFAGRITDWYKQKEGKDSYLPAEDPGVVSVKNIYNYIHKFGYKTQVMGASFRTADQVLELAGCDLLTVAPSILEELQNSQRDVEQRLSVEIAAQSPIEKFELNESTFKFKLNDNEMASFKLAEGIRKFAADQVKLENNIKKMIAS